MAQIENGHHIWRTQDCLLCGATSHAAAPICAPCHNTLPRLPAATCPRCLRPSPHNATCGACLQETAHVDAAHAAFRYTFPIDRLIQSFKYGHRLALATWLGEEIARLGEHLPADRIVPLPLHAERLRQRGFNQAVELARSLARARGLPLDTNCVERCRDTPPQADQPPAARQRNVRNAFHCLTDLSGQRLLLVDDVMTSGATLTECARTLKLHGAARVDVLLIARALPATTD